MEFSDRIGRALRLGAEYADLRIADFNVQAVNAENSDVNSIQSNDTYCYGVRAFAKGAWGFSYGTDVKNIDDTIKEAVKLAKISSRNLKESFKLADFPVYKDDVKSKARVRHEEIDVRDKIKRFLEFDKHLKREPIISRQISGSFTSGVSEFYNTDGSEIREEKDSFAFFINVVGKEKWRVQSAFDRVGLMAGYEEFDGINTENFCDGLHETITRLLRAETAPPGNMPVVIDPVLCHVFFHEAVGHACEADAVLENASVLGKKLGERVAPEFLNLSDSPAVEQENGYYKYDSEGILGKEAVLIKNGVLSEFMNSRETASKLDAEPNGHGRAESPMMIPYPRMSNTVLYPGKYKLDELFEGIKLGVYAKGSSGGVVDPNNGNFLFNSQEAFLIENGKVTKPLKDVSFGGNIIKTLTNVERIGNDFVPCRVGGRCGKKGQLVPVCGKCPSIKISEVMVGGK